MKIEQIMIPVTAGTKKDTIAHFQLLASFFIVKSVVEQGQCINENNITLIAVIHVQPFSTNKLFNITKLSISIKLPLARYAIIMIGITISLAGNPKINANKITPSRRNI